MWVETLLESWFNGYMSIRLTQTVQKGGCAAKVPAEVLRHVLGDLNFKSGDPNVLIDGSNFDDAGIYRIHDDLALVQTLDFFTPIVDTPFIFGQVAAANALSDVYAMGGSPKTAMAILAFPLSTLDPEVMKEVLSGAQDRISASGASLIGGHTIDDDTLKFGLSVTGLVHPKSMWSNQGAKPGDLLILTKPLGTGTLMAGLKESDYSEADIQDAIQSMIELNSILDLIPESLQKSIRAATDITGFGLSGHSMQVAKASDVSMRIRFDSLPVFEKTIQSLQADHLTKAHRSNRRYTESSLKFMREINPIHELILHDPQTSGGLLLSVEAAAAQRVLSSLQIRFSKASIIGTVTDLESHRIIIE